MQVSISQEEIVSYYDRCQVDYETVWHLNSRMAMHYGFWDETTSNLRAALINMNRRVAERAGIPRGSVVLDAGCGVGGSSIYLARNFDCKTIGITLSEQQVQTCQDNSRKHGMEGKCSFERQDFTKTSFGDATFDVVWAVESVCHANEKADFLKEAFRVLKPGGTLILADFFRQTDDRRLDNANYMDKWAATWAIPDFEFYKDFERKAAMAGFGTVKMDNVTDNILPSAKRLYYCFVPGIICDGVLRLMRRRNGTHKANVWSTYYQYKSLRQNLWNYYIFKAVKPS